MTTDRVDEPPLGEITPETTADRPYSIGATAGGVVPLQRQFGLKGCDMTWPEEQTRAVEPASIWGGMDSRLLPGYQDQTLGPGMAWWFRPEELPAVGAELRLWPDQSGFGRGVHIPDDDIGGIVVADPGPGGRAASWPPGTTEMRSPVPLLLTYQFTLVVVGTFGPTDLFHDQRSVTVGFYGGPDQPADVVIWTDHIDALGDGPFLTYPERFGLPFRVILRVRGKVVELEMIGVGEGTYEVSGPEAECRGAQSFGGSDLVAGDANRVNEIIYFDRRLEGQQLADLRAYLTARYP